MSRRSIAVSRASADALGVLGNQIKMARHDRGWTVADLAARLSVNLRTVTNIESGSPTVSIGTVFNAAFTVGVNLFGLEGPELARGGVRAKIARAVAKQGPQADREAGSR